MVNALSPQAMRALEARYMHAENVPSLELMERAATALFGALRAAGAAGHTVYFACGPGGNGGDGYAAARLFAQAGGHAVVLSPLGTDGLKGDARVNFQRAGETPGVTVARADEIDLLSRPFAWVDALFGIGLNRPADARAARLIARINADGADGSFVLAADIASGLNAQTGAAMGHCVRASETMAFGAMKYGHALGDGPEYSGKVTLCDLGIPRAMLPTDHCLRFDDHDLRAHLKPRARNSHKGDYGHLLIVAGSAGMAGAAALCAMAALKCGTGLVTVACPQSVLPVVQTLAPCAMAVPLPEKDGAIAAEAASALERALQKKTAVAIGPGLSLRASVQTVRAALESGLPAVLDADALNLLSENRDLLPLLGPRCVLTPHPGEAARLLGRKIENPVEDARALRLQNAVCVLKGVSSVIAGEETYLRTAGCSGLAKGGSGDVLTGMTGALLAQGYRVTDAAWIAAGLHGRLGEITAARLTETAMTARDLIDDLPALFSRV